MANVRWHVYLLGTLLGLIPETVLLVYFGTTIRSVSEILNGKDEVEPGQIAFLVLGIIITIGLLAFLIKLGRKAMREVDSEQKANSVESSSPSLEEQHQELQEGFCNKGQDQSGELSHEERLIGNDDDEDDNEDYEIDLLPARISLDVIGQDQGE